MDLDGSHHWSFHQDRQPCHQRSSHGRLHHFSHLRQFFSIAAARLWRATTLERIFTCNAPGSTPCIYNNSITAAPLYHLHQCRSPRATNAPTTAVFTVHTRRRCTRKLSLHHHGITISITHHIGANRELHLQHWSARTRLHLQRICNGSIIVSHGCATFTWNLHEQPLQRASTTVVSPKNETTLSEKKKKNTDLRHSRTLPSTTTTSQRWQQSSSRHCISNLQKP